MTPRADRYQAVGTQFRMTRCRSGMAAADVVCYPAGRGHATSSVRPCLRPPGRGHACRGIPEAVHSAPSESWSHPGNRGLAEAWRRAGTPPGGSGGTRTPGSIPTWEQSAKNVYDVLDRAIRDR